MVRIQLFGRVGLIGPDGNFCEFETRKVATVAAILSLRPGKNYERQVLAETVWPDSDPESARSSLRQGLSSLRRALADQATALEADRFGCRLNPEQASSDASDFLTAVRGAALDAPGPRSVPLERALSLYSGKPLDGLKGPWADWARDLLRKRLEACRQELVDALLAEGDYERAATAGLAALAAKPWSEAAATATVQALIKLGRTTEAAEVFRTCSTALWERLNVAPSAELRSLAEAVKGDAPATGPPSKAVLPGSLAAIIGRERELESLAGLLDPGQRGPRLVTLFGTGGVGKTRLANEAANRLQSAYAGRVAWCDLSSVDDPGQIVPEALSALAAPLEHGIEGLDAYLGPAPYLLVLDNLEQFGSSARGPVASLVQRARGLRLLATSRDQLEIEGETIFRLAPLETEAANPGDAPAVRLFVELARMVRPELDLDGDELDVVADICRQLDGLPLAIRLAASKVEILSSKEIRDQAKDRFHLLTTDDARLPERHRSLLASIEWTYELLPSAKLFFAQLGVFPGTFTLAACQAVAKEPAALEVMEMLARRSLVVAEPSSRGTRYRLLASVREFARRVLPEDESAAARERFTEYYSDWIAKVSEEARGPGLWSAHREITDEFHNLRQAYEWSLASAPVNALQIAYSLGAYFDARGLYETGLEWLKAADQAATDPPAELALGAASDIAQLYVRLRRPADAAAALGSRHGLLGSVPAESRALFLISMGSANLMAGNVEAALRHFRQARDECGETTPQRIAGVAEGNVALALLMLGDLEGAQAAAESTLPRAKESGIHSTAGSCLYTLAHVALCRSDLATAERLCRDSIATLEGAGMNAALSGRFTLLSELLTCRGAMEEALETLHRSVSRLRESRMERDLADCARAAGLWCRQAGLWREAAAFFAFYEPYVNQGFVGRSAADPRPSALELLEEARAALPSAEYEECRGKGRTWSLAEMVAAIGELSVPEPVRKSKRRPA